MNLNFRIFTDGEDDEKVEDDAWEDQQIRKGVSNAQVRRQDIRVISFLPICNLLMCVHRYLRSWRLLYNKNHFINNIT